MLIQLHPSHTHTLQTVIAFSLRVKTLTLQIRQRIKACLRSCRECHRNNSYFVCPKGDIWRTSIHLSYHRSIHTRKKFRPTDLTRTRAFIPRWHGVVGTGEPSTWLLQPYCLTSFPLRVWIVCMWKGRKFCLLNSATF